jgi:hypothetical protein
MTKHAARLVSFPGEATKPLVHVLAETVSEATCPTGDSPWPCRPLFAAPHDIRIRFWSQHLSQDISLPCSQLLVVPLPKFHFEAVSFSAV